MSRIERIENALNRISDSDDVWWPFLSLRPAIDQRMTSLQVAKMALSYGTFGGGLAALVLWALGRIHSVSEVVRIPFIIIVAFFVLYSATFALSWNRRAARLRRGSTASE